MVSPQNGETLSSSPCFSVTPLALMSLVCLNFIHAFVANRNKMKLLALLQICPVLCDLILFFFRLYDKTFLLTRNSAVSLSVEYTVEVLSNAELHIHPALDEAGPPHTFR